jgi:hypothetical protein
MNKSGKCVKKIQWCDRAGIIGSAQLDISANTFNIVSDKKLHKIDDKGSLQYRLRGS